MTPQDHAVDRNTVNYSTKETTLNQVSLPTAQTLVAPPVAWNHLTLPDVQSLAIQNAQSCCYLVTALNLPAVMTAQSHCSQSLALTPVTLIVLVNIVMRNPSSPRFRSTRLIGFFLSCGLESFRVRVRGSLLTLIQLHLSIA